MLDSINLFDAELFFLFLQHLSILLINHTFGFFKFLFLDFLIYFYLFLQQPWLLLHHFIFCVHVLELKFSFNFLFVHIEFSSILIFHCIKFLLQNYLFITFDLVKSLSLYRVWVKFPLMNLSDFTLFARFKLRHNEFQFLWVFIDYPINMPLLLIFIYSFRCVLFLDQLKLLLEFFDSLVVFVLLLFFDLCEFDFEVLVRLHLRCTCLHLDCLDCLL